VNCDLKSGVNDPIKADERLTCDECGRFGAVEIGDAKLCTDCYGTKCSCCPEFGREKTEEIEP
jgi:hypothetical protein